MEENDGWHEISVWLAVDIATFAVTLENTAAKCGGTSCKWEDTSAALGASLFSVDFHRLNLGRSINKDLAASLASEAKDGIATHIVDDPPDGWWWNPETDEFQPTSASQAAAEHSRLKRLQLLSDAGRGGIDVAFRATPGHVIASQKIWNRARKCAEIFKREPTESKEDYEKRQQDLRKKYATESRAKILGGSDTLFLSAKEKQYILSKGGAAGVRNLLADIRREVVSGRALEESLGARDILPEMYAFLCDKFPTIQDLYENKYGRQILLAICVPNRICDICETLRLAIDGPGLAEASDAPSKIGGLARWFGAAGRRSGEASTAAMSSASSVDDIEAMVTAADRELGQKRGQFDFDELIRNFSMSSDVKTRVAKEFFYRVVNRCWNDGALSEKELKQLAWLADKVGLTIDEGSGLLTRFLVIKLLDTLPRGVAL